MFFLSCVCYAFVHVCLYVHCGHLLGKGCLFDSRLWCLTVSVSLSHWYPGSGVVLDCIAPLHTMKKKSFINRGQLVIFTFINGANWSALSEYKLVSCAI